MNNPLARFAGRRRALAAVATTGAVCIGMLVTSSSTTAASAPAKRVAFDPATCLKYIAASQLAQGGFTLSSPVVSSPATSGASAVTGAATAYSGFPINDVCLAHVRDAYSDLDADVWIVDITPPGGFRPPSDGAPGSPQHMASFLIVLFDAATGKYLFGAAA